ncbi:MAG: hypothetical protein ACKOC4_10715 [Planctomycetia bacterium]
MPKSDAKESQSPDAAGLGFGSARGRGAGFGGGAGREAVGSAAGWAPSDSASDAQGSWGS